MLPQADAYIMLLLGIASDQSLEDLRSAKGRKAKNLAYKVLESANVTRSAYWDATEEDRIWVPMRERIEAACVGQPDIVQRALREGVSRNWHSLTKHELGQLRSAVKKGLLVVIKDQYGTPQFVRSHQIEWNTDASPGPSERVCHNNDQLIRLAPDLLTFVFDYIDAHDEAYVSAMASDGERTIYDELMDTARMLVYELTNSDDGVGGTHE